MAAKKMSSETAKKPPQACRDEVLQRSRFLGARQRNKQPAMSVFD